MGTVYSYTNPFFMGEPIPGPPVIGTAITTANPAVVSCVNTFAEGQSILMMEATPMEQIAGMIFTISSVTGSQFTLLGLDSSGFANPATELVAKTINFVEPVQPQFLYITKITNSYMMVVTVSTVHDYIVNQVVHLSVPPSFNMVQADQLTGQILAVTAYTMTLNIDSTNFSLFTFPASGALINNRLFATLSPSGQRNNYDILTVPFH